MQEDLIVLLEWLNANGINDIFNDNVCINDVEEVDTEKKEVRNLNTFVKALAQQQKEITHLNPIFGQISEIKSFADKLNNIDDITKFINSSNIYNNFKESATNTIIFNGNINSKILIINDLPNSDNDVSGNVFDGENSILLENMMKSINLTKDDYCLLNSFFWRLPGDRSPIKEELEVCKPFIEKIISIMKPSLIIFTGNYSLSTIFKNNTNLISVRGKILDYTNCYLQDNIKITAIYSPTFLIKNKIKKRDTWQDLLKIKNFLN